VVLERHGAGVSDAAAPETAARIDEGAGDSLLVSMAQVEPRLGDVATNLARHHGIIGEAAARGADLVVFPELSLTGYFLKDLVPEVAVRLDGEEVRELAAACRETSAIVGCVLESDDSRFYNAALYLSGGEVRHIHRKVYLPTYGLFDERRYLAAGGRFHAFEILARESHRPWMAGLLLCEDMWHPTSLALLARQGVDVFVCPSASPGRGVLRGMALGTANSYDVMTRTYAQLLTSYLVYCNRVGYEDGINFWGGSRVVGPDGALSRDPAGADEALVYERLERTALRRARIETPLLRDERHDVNDAETDRIRLSQRHP
jgi:predicted amidohydrolase